MSLCCPVLKDRVRDLGEQTPQVWVSLEMQKVSSTDLYYRGCGRCCLVELSKKNPDLISFPQFIRLSGDIEILHYMFWIDFFSWYKFSRKYLSQVISTSIVISISLGVNVTYFSDPMFYYFQIL